MKKKTIGIKSLQKCLSESAFNPKEDGPLKIICDQNDPKYCEMRAVELIREAQIAISNLEQIDDDRWIKAEMKPPSEMLKEAYQEKIKLAMSLLAYARVLRRLV